MSYAHAMPAAFPRAAAFTRANATGIGGRAAMRAPLSMRRAPGFKGRSLRAAWLAATGGNARRVAAKLALAQAALESGAPIAWPRGFA